MRIMKKFESVTQETDNSLLYMCKRVTFFYKSHAYHYCSPQRVHFFLAVTEQ